MPENELRIIIQGCIEGRRKAQEQMFKMFYSKMLTVCMRYTNDVNEASDILQDGFLKVFSKLDRFDYKGSFEGWVRRIMVNTAIDSIRKKKNDFVLLNEDQSLEQLAKAEEEFEEQEVQYKPAQIIAAMQKLTPGYRTIFNLYVFENLTHREIAEQLGINEGTSKSNYAKAKRNLKKILENGTY